MSTTASHATRLIPNTTDLVLEVVTIGATAVTAILLATRREAPCPLCCCLSRRMHSRNQRTLADLPWSQQRVRLVLSVRKFFCNVETSPRRIFTEFLPGVVTPYGRCTTRLTDILPLLAFALGGEGGVRIVDRLGFTTSLKLIKRQVYGRASFDRVRLRVLHAA